MLRGGTLIDGTGADPVPNAVIVLQYNQILDVGSAAALRAPAGQFLCTREVLNQSMLALNEGTLIFVSSGSGKKGEEDSSAYCASKWGVIGFAESVANDLKKTGIRVTVLTPGMIETPMAMESEAWNLGLDWLNPQYVSEAIVFCVKQDANTIFPEMRVYHRAQI